MNNYAWVGQVSAPVAILVGVLICFWGYRIVRLCVGLAGLVAGASGGWTVGWTLAPGNQMVALVCAVVGGIAGAFLAIWLFYLGVFLLGASAGAVVAGAAFNGTGHQAQPILFIGVVVVFGLLALVLRKFMLILCTAFSGSYLITAGVLRLVTASPSTAPLWFNPAQPGSATTLNYLALGGWLLLGLIGMQSQWRGSRRREVVVRQEVQTA